MQRSSKENELPSGRFLLRVGPEVHARLRDAAGEAGLSLNAYCARRLASPAIGLTNRGGPTTAVARAAILFGADLIGVAAFGSWARGEDVAASDVDLLVVLEDGVRLRRSLLRSWDESPVEWEGKRVEPQFVHLPPPGETVAGIWAEVALDAIILLDPTLRLSARLVHVRRDIAGGRVVRRTAHGQPYWVLHEVA
jgi:hypothetical protein